MCKRHPSWLFVYSRWGPKRSDFQSILTYRRQVYLWHSALAVLTRKYAQTDPLVSPVVLVIDLSATVDGPKN